MEYFCSYKIDPIKYVLFITKVTRGEVVLKLI